ncbi:transposase [Trichormus azollae]|uniref:transposase n=1 Tax=Trichormus azollae TaxID=1164 RepID=UPI00325E4D52
MIVFEFKAKAKCNQYRKIDEAIRITQFIRNKCLRFWMDNSYVNPYDLNKYTTVLANEFDFADKLNSIARQAAASRTAFAIKRFFDNSKAKIPGKKDILSYRKVTVLLNIKLAVGNYQMTRNTLLLQGNVVLVN